MGTPQVLRCLQDALTCHKCLTYSYQEKVLNDIALPGLFQGSPEEPAATAAAEAGGGIFCASSQRTNLPQTAGQVK